MRYKCGGHHSLGGRHVLKALGIRCIEGVGGGEKNLERAPLDLSAPPSMVDEMCQIMGGNRCIEGVSGGGRKTYASTFGPQRPPQYGGRTVEFLWKSMH